MGPLSDDLFLAFVRYCPFAFVFGGIGVVMWLSRQRLPYELQPDLLAALSDTEALPPTAIRSRPPLAQQDVDMQDLVRLLEELRANGQVVRWSVRANGQSETVYRKISRRRRPAWPDVQPGDDPSPFK